MLKYGQRIPGSLLLVSLLPLLSRLLKIYGTGLMIVSTPGRGTTISYTIPRGNPSIDRAK